jgi:nucleoside-diphosphate-sugar epimerase
VAEAPDGGEIEIWGHGKQTRSFLYTDERLEGTIRLTRFDFTGPVNIGSDEMVTIDQLADMIIAIARKNWLKSMCPGPRVYGAVTPITGLFMQNWGGSHPNH